MKLWSSSQFKKCSRRRSPLALEDRISFLPDDILYIVLSFLSLKEVAITSLLSHQWLKLWLHNPLLNFHAPFSDALDISKRERRNYVDWVNSVLHKHQGDFVKEFRILCYLNKRYQKDIDSWLAYALARKVESLQLNLFMAGFQSNQKENYAFPKRFFNLSHEEAIEFVSSNSIGKSFLKFDFKPLKSLSLKGVDITGEEINFFLVNCPYLERLEVVSNSKLVNLVISDPTLVLKHLVMVECFNLEFLNISNFNLVSLIISSLADLTLTDLPMLVELSITGADEDFSRVFSQASSCYSQLESLTLKIFDHERVQDIIQLSNLTQMTKVKKLVIEVQASGDDSLEKLLFFFINSCPHLVEFVLMVHWWSPDRTDRAVRKGKGKKCSLKCLEVFEFIGYYGRVSDVELITQVAENAVCLKKIIIDPSCALGIFTPESQEARSVALNQYEGLRKSIPTHVDLVIR